MMSRIVMALGLFCLLCTSPLLGQRVPPGVVITKSDNPKEVYCGSPSILRLSSGSYLATHTLYGPNLKKIQTHVYRSSNRGVSWEKCATVDGVTWASLFELKGDVYLLGTNREPGEIAIRKSSDEGDNWVGPDQPLLKGRYSSEPSAVLIHNNTIYKTYAEVVDGQSKEHLFSASTDSDLLDPESWSVIVTSTMKTDYLGGKRNHHRDGNPVIAPDGSLAVVSRCNSQPLNERAKLIQYKFDELPRSELFETNSMDTIIRFPGGGTKFTVRFDKQSNRYWTISNPQRNPFAAFNRLTLMSSSDLINWKDEGIIFHHLDNIWHGKKFADWVIEGDDLLVITQCAWDGCRSTHYPNFVTFDRVRNFRNFRGVLRPMGTVATFRHETQTLSIKGTSVSLHDLKPDAIAFSTFGVRYTDIPPKFNGWKFVRTRGGKACEISVRAKANSKIYMMTPINAETVDVTGWTMEKEFVERDGGREKMHIFSRVLSKDESVEIPQGTWAGSQLLVPPS